MHDMANRRRSPYVWPTWITKLLAGENNCLWGAWFRANHYYEKRVDEKREATLRTWTQNHTALLHRRAEELRQEGYEVRVEDQNKFGVLGKNGAMLGGKPDLLALKPDHLLISDTKSGRRRDSDQAQVEIYLTMAPSAYPEFKDLPMVGEICYPDGQVKVEPPGSGFRVHLKTMMDRMAGKEAPPRVPSVAECRFCDIAECPARVTAPEGSTEPTETDVF